MNTIDSATATPATTSVIPASIPSIPTRSTLMNAKVAISFLSTNSDADLITACGRILVALTGNTHYPTPKPTLAAVSAARDVFVASVAALDRGKVSIAVRNAARVPLVQLLRELSLYVQQTAQGDRVVLLGSGYPLQKTRQPIGIPAAPQNLRLKQGNSGQLIARCNVVPAALSYQWRFASLQAPTAWTQAEPTGKASCTLHDLAAGTQYTVQVRVVGRKGASDWCTAASLFVN